MSLVFRNLSTSPEAPVAEWPGEAVRAALERGYIDDWRRIVAEIRRSPWGGTARHVEELLAHSRPYGVAELMEDEISRARAGVEAAERATVAEEVRRAIAESGLTRAQFASLVGTSTSRLSTYATGRVIPSGSMMVRMRRVAEQTGRATLSHHGNQTSKHR